MQPKISLAIIAGNVEKHIHRFLDCFEPVADEIIVVRAIGNQEPDGTLDICKNRGCIVAEYANAPEHQDWPHVDDFGAARNAAFDLASHEWVMWADTDDVITPDSAAILRDAVAHLAEKQPDAAGLLFRYNVPDDGLTIFRERIIRKGAARWRGPIHETLKLHDENAALVKVEEGEILHSSGGRPSTSDERNARILEAIPKESRTVSQRFHLFQSLKALGRDNEAAIEAVEVLKNPPPEMEAPEKYELFIAVGQMANDLPTRANLFLQAVATDPTRREAYGELAWVELACGNNEQAEGWARAMDAQPPPRDFIWNLRHKFYGWLGTATRAATLRAKRDFAGADAIELNHFLKSGAKISLIHATRGRPIKASKVQREWMQLAANPDAIEHIFCIDADDPQSSVLALYRHVCVPPGGGCVRAWNAGAAMAKGEIIIQVADDLHPPLHWDKILLDRIGDTSKEVVCHVSDGARTDDLICLSICTRARVKAKGYFLHPRFKSVFSDNWYSYSAYKDGVVLDMRDVVFEHRHPFFGKAEWDKTYIEGNAKERYEEGEKIFNELKAEHYGDTEPA